MQIFTQEDHLSHIIQTDIDLLPVLNRFGVRMGVKDKTVNTVCQEKNINVKFLLAIINTYHNPGYFPEDQLLKFSPILIINYLRKTHNYYISFLLPEIEKLLSALMMSCKEKCIDLKIIDTFYQKYKEELLTHIEDEERNVFPAIVDYINHPQLHKDFSIISFEKEHTNVDHKLNDLKNLIIKYLEPSYDDNACYTFLKALMNFEKDIRDHARIEDKILVKKVLQLENK